MSGKPKKSLGSRIAASVRGKSSHEPKEPSQYKYGDIVLLGKNLSIFLFSFLDLILKLPNPMALQFSTTVAPRRRRNRWLSQEFLVNGTEEEMG